MGRKAAESHSKLHKRACLPQLLSLGGPTLRLHEGRPAAVYGRRQQESFEREMDEVRHAVTSLAATVHDLQEPRQ
eukprot:12999200-Alexandrium_andersonii.AAC.1